MKKNKNQHRVQDILKLIRTERDPYFLERALDSYHDHDIADVLPLLSSPEWKRLASLLPAPYLADLMEYVDDKESLLRFCQLKGQLPSSPRWSLTKPSIS